MRPGLWDGERVTASVVTAAHPIEVTAVTVSRPKRSTVHSDFGHGELGDCRSRRGPYLDPRFVTTEHWDVISPVTPGHRG